MFCNIEGSIIAKVGQDESIHSQAAVLANICHEFIEFGQQAFNDNKLQCIFIQHDQALFVAKPIFGLVLCFVCEPGANLGLIRAKIDGMSSHLEKNLVDLSKHLQQASEEINDE